MVKKQKKKSGKEKLAWKIRFTLLALYFAWTPKLVYASGIEATWNILMEEIFIWIPKLGITSIVFGGIEFAMAKSNEDANQQVRGTRFLASGCLILAICETLKPFLV